MIWFPMGGHHVPRALTKRIDSRIRVCYDQDNNPDPANSAAELHHWARHVPIAHHVGLLQGGSSHAVSTM